MSEVVEYRSTIKDMPSGDRPRERLAFAGAGALANAELLAIILRGGAGGCELGGRLRAPAPDDRTQIRTPLDAANILMSEMALLEQEQMRVVLLDTRNRIICVPTVYVGSLNTTLVG